MRKKGKLLDRLSKDDADHDVVKSFCLKTEIQSLELEAAVHAGTATLETIVDTAFENFALGADAQAALVGDRNAACKELDIMAYKSVQCFVRAVRETSQNLGDGSSGTVVEQFSARVLEYTARTKKRILEVELGEMSSATNADPSEMGKPCEGEHEIPEVSEEQRSIWRRNWASLEASIDVLKGARGFAAARVNLSLATEPIIVELERAPSPALRAIDLFDETARTMIELVNDTQTRDAFVDVLANDYYPRAHVFLIGAPPESYYAQFGGSCSRWLSGHARDLVCRLDARHRFWQTEAYRRGGDASSSAIPRDEHQTLAETTAVLKAPHGGTADFLDELFAQFDPAAQARIRSWEASAKRALEGGAIAVRELQRLAGAWSDRDWVLQPHDNARAGAAGVLFIAFINELWARTDMARTERIQAFLAEVDKLIEPILKRFGGSEARETITQLRLECEQGAWRVHSKLLASAAAASAKPLAVEETNLDSTATHQSDVTGARSPVWTQIQAEFQRFTTDHPDLAAEWISVHHQWNFKNESPGSQHLFKVVAARAAGRLNMPGNSDWRVWLDELRAEGYARVVPPKRVSMREIRAMAEAEGLGEARPGEEVRRIEHLFQSSAAFCHVRSLEEDYESGASRWPDSTTSPSETVGPTERKPPQSINPPAETAKIYKTAIGQRIDLHREECGWSYDVLAEQSKIEKTSILDHVNLGTIPRPQTLKTYADTFSKALGKTITVADLKS